MLALDPGGRSPFGPAKWAVVTPAALVAFACSRGGSVGRRITGAWIAVLGWVLVCASFGLDEIGAWIGTPERRYGAIAWMVGAAAFFAGTGLDARGRTAMARATALAGGVVGAWTIAELAGWRPMELTGVGARPGGTLGTSAYLGAAALLTGGVAVRELGDPDGATWWRLTAGLSAVLATVAWVSSGARAAWVGGALGLTAFVVLGRPWRQRGIARSAVVLMAFAAAVIGLGVATGMSDRATAVVTDQRGGARGRIDEWRVAARVVAAHPVTGVGPEGYRIAFGGAVDDSYEQVHGRDPLPDRAHSAPLDVAATLGVPGLALVLLLVGCVAAASVPGCRDDHRRAASVAILVAYAGQSLFLFPLAELDPTAWQLAGTLIPAKLPGRRWTAAPAAVAAVVLGAVGLIGVVADREPRNDRAARWRPDVAGYHLAEAADHEAVGSSAGLDRAIAAIEDARRWHPRDPVVVAEHTRLLLERAQRTGSPRHVTAARGALEAAAGHDPRNAALLLRLGVARSLDGDDRAAEAAWRASERLAPRRAAASVDLALLYARTGRVDEARAAAARALIRDPDNLIATQVLEATDGT